MVTEPQCETSRAVESLKALQSLVPDSGLKNLAQVEEMIKELISEEYTPYLLGNAALHISFSCKRCGRCCVDNPNIALSLEDCRSMANRLGLSSKRFIIEYTVPHVLSREKVGNARMIKKAEGDYCPLYNPKMPGCSIHESKPQVCRAAYYLAKMNLVLCEEAKSFSTFPQCPGDVELRARLKDLREKLKEDQRAARDAERVAHSTQPEHKLFRLLLRLKGIEIYFGEDKASTLARKLGLRRMPHDEELLPAAFLYASTLRGPPNSEGARP